MGRFGRPTKYTDDMPDLAYAVLAEGGPLSKVAATLDISLETLNVWRKDSGKPEFSEAIKRGLAVAESIWDDPDYKPEMHPTRYKAYMMHRYGWSERMSTEVTGKDGGPLQSIIDVILSSSDDVLSRVRGGQALDDDEA